MSFPFNRLCWALPFLFAAGLVIRSPLAPDLDLYLHLKSGEGIMKAKALPEFDHFTFTSNHEREETHSWLSQVLLFEVEKLAGERGLQFLHFLLIALLLWLLARTLPSSIASAAMLFFLIVQNTLLVLRPFLLGQVCFALCAFALFPKRRWYLSLAVVTFWGNLHGSVLVVFPLLIFELLKSGLTRKDLFFAGSVGLCAFLNPTNFQLVESAMTLSQVGKSAGIWEWQGRDFAQILSVSTQSFFNASGVVINCFLVFGMGAALALWRRRDRNAFPLFVFCVAPFFATRHLAFAAVPIALLFRFFPGGAKPAMVLGAGLLACLIGERTPTDPFRELKAATEILKRENYEGPVLNFAGFGSYLIYAGYPQWKVMADRRLSVNSDYYRFENWMKKNYGGISVELLTERFPQAKMLVFHRAGIPQNFKILGWRPLFEGQEVAVWTRLPARSVDQITLR